MKSASFDSDSGGRLILDMYSRLRTTELKVASVRRARNRYSCTQRGHCCKMNVNHTSAVRSLTRHGADFKGTTGYLTDQSDCADRCAADRWVTSGRPLRRTYQPPHRDARKSRHTPIYVLLEVPEEATHLHHESEVHILALWRCAPGLLIPTARDDVNALHSN